MCFAVRLGSRLVTSRRMFSAAGGKAAADVAAAYIADHEHGMHVAGHRQIQDLQLPVFGVLVLVVLVRQGHALLLQETAGADLDVVVVAPGGKAQPAVDLQILDREQDVGAVLNDLTEQPLQSYRRSG